MTAVLRLLLAAWLLGIASVATAQVGSLLSPDSGAEESAPTEEPADPAAGQSLENLRAAADDLPLAFDDLPEWEETANRVETALEAGRVSTATLDDLRAQLSVWRDRFLSRQGINAERIETLREQIAALGEPSEQEDPRVTARREALIERRERLSAPGDLAAEAHARADGLISEIDAIIRDRQAAQLTKRVQTPLLPAGWVRAFTDVVDGYRAIRNEISANWSNPVRREAAIGALPVVLLSLSVGLLLLARGQRWTERLEGRVTTRSKRGRGVWRFVISLGKVVLPMLGVMLVVFGVMALGLVGRRGLDILQDLPLAALIPIVGHWISRLLFLPTVAGTDPALDIPEEYRGKATRLMTLLGYVVGATLLVTDFMEATGFDADSRGVVTFVLGVLLVVPLLRVAAILRKSAVEDEVEASDEDQNPARSFRFVMRRLLARVLLVMGVVGLAVGALGYVAALELIVVPAAITLYVLGLLIVLQRLSVDLYTLLSGIDDGAQDALIPVLIGFALAIASLPVLALVWGARQTDLTEIWTRFQEGFSLGETHISPTDFLTFAVVFVLGYTVTRLLQGALRSSILPRTRIDIGGQNAIIAGVGYLGIFLAAVIAITTAGIDLSGLAIVAGALSVGIGFGLQNIVSNFVSGIILLIERPISEGDWIEVGGQMGYVRDISVRSTRIETFDRTDVIIPNADLVSGQVTNWTRGNSVGRVIVPVGVAYGTDTAEVERILMEVAEGHPLVLANPAPAVIFQGFGADSLDFEIRAILRDVNWVLSVKSEMNHEIAKRFAEAGIEIPFAQRDIWLRNPEALRGRDPASAELEADPQDTEPADPADGPDTDSGEAG